MRPLLLAQVALALTLAAGSEDNEFISNLETDITRPSYEEILYKHYPKYTYRGVTDEDDSQNTSSVEREKRQAGGRRRSGGGGQRRNKNNQNSFRQFRIPQIDIPFRCVFFP